MGSSLSCGCNDDDKNQRERPVERLEGQGMENVQGQPALRNNVITSESFKIQRDRIPGGTIQFSAVSMYTLIQPYRAHTRVL